MSRATRSVELPRLLEVRGPLVLALNQVGQIAAWNPTLLDLLGAPLEAARGQAPWETLVDAEDRASVRAGIERALAGEPATLEGHWRDRHRARRWLVWSIDRVMGAEGALEGLVLVGLDRSAPERAMAALELSQAKFAGIVSISADAVVSVDETQRIVIFNESAERTFGFPASEVIGQKLDVLIPERFRARHAELMRAFAEGEVSSLRHAGAVGLRRDGEEFPAESAISKLEVSGARLLTVAMQDITVRRAMEDEQRFLVELGDGLSESLEPAQILARIAALTVPFVGDGCVADLLLEEAQVRRVAVVHRDDAMAAMAERLRDVIVDLAGPSFVAAAIQKREPVLLGEVRPEQLDAAAQSQAHRAALMALAPASLMAVPLVARGQVMGSLLFMRSAGARRYRPADLRLAQEVARRAAIAIENGRLYDAAQMAIQARDRTLSVVAHDLRNPLAAISLAATALSRSAPPDAPTHRHAGRILRASGRMGRLIEDLLDIQRIETGRLGLERATWPIDALLDAVVDAERPLAQAAGLALTLAPHPPGLTAFVDRDRLGQVFANLVGNAIKFTPEGGTLTLGVAPSGADLVFRVSDTGPGIDPEQAAHLFDRFWQARRADRRGAGLGLPICKGIVEAHGGSLWVESEVGRGTTFRFKIPARPGGAPEEAGRSD